MSAESKPLFSDEELLEADRARLHNQEADPFREGEAYHQTHEQNQLLRQQQRLPA